MWLKHWTIEGGKIKAGVWVTGSLLTPDPALAISTHTNRHTHTHTHTDKDTHTHTYTYKDKHTHNFVHTQINTNTDDTLRINTDKDNPHTKIHTDWNPIWMQMFTRPSNLITLKLRCLVVCVINFFLWCFSVQCLAQCVPPYITPA